MMNEKAVDSFITGGYWGDTKEHLDSPEIGSDLECPEPCNSCDSVDSHQPQCPEYSGLPRLIDLDYGWYESPESLGLDWRDQDYNNKPGGLFPVDSQHCSNPDCPGNINGKGAGVGWVLTENMEGYERPEWFAFYVSHVPQFVLLCEDCGWSAD